jgi:hypothetical protein
MSEYTLNGVLQKKELDVTSTVDAKSHLDGIVEKALIMHDSGESPAEIAAYFMAECRERSETMRFITRINLEIVEFAAGESRTSLEGVLRDFRL